MQAKTNEAYRLRLQHTAQLLGKDLVKPKGEDDEEADEVQTKPAKSE